MTRSTKYKESIRMLRSGEPVPKSEPRRYVAASGYVRLRWKVGTGEYVEVYEHRLRAGMPPEHLEVHHLNRVRDDNRPENLVVLTKVEHAKLHAEENRDEYARRREARGGYRSVGAWQKAQRARARRDELHERAMKMRAMYEAGATTIEIGKAFGLSSQNVSVHLRRVGTKMRGLFGRAQ